MNIVEKLAARLVGALYPLSVMRSYQAWSTENWLADVEADHESWEPDELWAAQQRHPAGVTSETAAGIAPPATPPRLTVVRGGAAEPVQTGGTPTFKSDDEFIEELVEDYRQFLIDCFNKKFPK